MKTPLRCNFCRKPAVVRLSWTATTRKLGQRRAVPVFALACEDHEQCSSMTFYATAHPDAKLERVYA